MAFARLVNDIGRSNDPQGQRSPLDYGFTQTENQNLEQIDDDIILDSNKRNWSDVQSDFTQPPHPKRQKLQHMRWLSSEQQHYAQSMRSADSQ